jgi:hypothetical protein
MTSQVHSGHLCPTDTRVLSSVRGLYPPFFTLTPQSGVCKAASLALQHRYTHNRSHNKPYSKSSSPSHLMWGETQSAHHDHGPCVPYHSPPAQQVPQAGPVHTLDWFPGFSSNTASIFSPHPSDFPWLSPTTITPKASAFFSDRRQPPFQGGISL